MENNINKNATNKNDRPDQHQKGTLIVVNGRQMETYEKKLSFEEIVRLALNEYNPSDTTVYTVTYSKDSHDKGMLVPGDNIPVRKGLVFNVTKTTRS